MYWYRNYGNIFACAYGNVEFLLLTDKEEHDFMKEVCLAALSADKKEVKFAAVLDENGRLLVGEYNRRQFFQNINNTQE